MGIQTAVTGWTTRQCARFLATKIATPLVLTGTLALAGIGAVAATPSTPHQNLPVYPNSSCFLRWDGSSVCHLPPSQVRSYPNAYWCHPSQMYPGTDVCFFWNK